MPAANNCEDASVSAAERILVSSADEQLFIEVWLVKDDEFRQELDHYEASISERIPLDQPATVRMRECPSKPSTLGGQGWKLCAKCPAAQELTL
jgi:hypothetical protein